MRTQLLVLSLALFQASLSAQQVSQPKVPKRPEAQEHPDTKNGQKKTDAIPKPAVPPSTAVAGDIGQPTSNPEKNDSDQTKDTLQKVKDFVDMAVGIALAVTAICGVRVALRTLRAIETQVTANKEAASAAKQSADTADASAKFSENVLRLTERADVLIDAVELSTPGELRLDTIFTVVLTNFGRTRANELRTDFSIGLAGAFSNGHSTDRPPTILGSGDELKTRLPQVSDFLTGEAYREVLEGKTPLRFEGTFSYLDVFDATHTGKASGTFSHETDSFLVEQYRAD